MAKGAKVAAAEFRKRQVELIREIVTKLALKHKDAFIPTAPKGEFVADLGEGVRWYTLRPDLVIAGYLNSRTIEKVPDACRVSWTLRSCQELIEKATSNPLEFDGLASAFSLGQSVATELSIGITQNALRNSQEALLLAIDLAKSRTPRRKASQKRGEESAILTKGEWSKVVKERDSRARRDRKSKKSVSLKIAAELAAGKFDGIGRKLKRVPTADTIRNKVVKR